MPEFINRQIREVYNLLMVESSHSKGPAIGRKLPEARNFQSQELTEAAVCTGKS
ncbi:hypothetical protein J6590_094363 [Homalodisca vitripennis]|nr:hypothetical protein J6590_094363 [Homalodisca vitripennis]